MTGFKIDKSFAKKLGEIGKTHVRVGWGENQHYTTGESVSMVATQNEFGNPSKHIPPRPFFRPTLDREREKLLRLMGREIKNILHGGNDVADAFDFVGQYLAGQVKWSIHNLRFTPLAVKTVVRRLKGKTQGRKVSLKIATPLVHTAYLINSIVVEVKQS